MSIISKKKMNELLNLSNDPKIELVEETKKSYKIKITGDKDKYLHHNNRSCKNNFLFYKVSNNSFINVKIKLIFSNSFLDINWRVI